MTSSGRKEKSGLFRIGLDTLWQEEETVVALLGAAKGVGG